MHNNKVDYIIVGTGLAGCCLALELHQRGYKLKIYHNPYAQQASFIAAGILNPFLGKKLTPIFDIEKSLHTAHKHYRYVEQISGTALFHAAPIFRNLDTTGILDYYHQRKLYFPHLFGDIIELNGRRYIEIYKGGWLDTKNYCEKVIEYLKLNQTIIERPFDYCDDIPRLESKTHVIFAEGIEVKNNPFFSDLPLKPSKGETIEFEIEHRNEDYILVDGFFARISGKKVRIGATASWNKMNHEPSDDAKKQLLEFTKKIGIQSQETINQSVGIRPNAHDRMPYLGRHEKRKNFVIFNGFGGKGVSHIPNAALTLCNHLESNDPLPKEFDINRL